MQGATGHVGGCAVPRGACNLARDEPDELRYTLLHGRLTAGSCTWHNRVEERVAGLIAMGWWWVSGVGTSGMTLASLDIFALPGRALFIIRLEGRGY